MGRPHISRAALRVRAGARGQRVLAWLCAMHDAEALAGGAGWIHPASRYRSAA